MGWEMIAALTIASVHFIAMVAISLWEKVSYHCESREIDHG